MRQRVMIAMSLLCQPDLLIADEPTTALDVTIQAQILDLMADLKREMNMSVTLITHDLGVIAGIADRVMVMYAGRIAELAGSRIFSIARSIPIRAASRFNAAPLGGCGRGLALHRRRAADLRHLPSGCAYRPRCPNAFERCIAEL